MFSKAKKLPITSPKSHKRNILSSLTRSTAIISENSFFNLFHELKKNPLAVIGFCFLLFILTLAIFGPIFSPYLYHTTELVSKNSPPSLSHFFGTDELGRDLFTRCAYGARISLFVGLTAAIIDLVIGMLWGAIAALSPRKLDELLMRICDILSALPNLLVVILLLMIMGPGITSIILALSITGWITMARIVRAKVYQLKKMDYVEAARSMGASYWRILFQHLLPNATGPIIVTLTLTIPAAIFSEAFLSFIGLGIQAPIASWGTMVNDGINAMIYYPWRLFFPAVLITITILAFNLIGDALRDFFDPRMKI